MKKEFITMAMPAIVEICDEISNSRKAQAIEEIIHYLNWVDETFSTFKTTSAISQINAKKISPVTAHPEVQKVLKLAEDTKRISNGYFDVYRKGFLDPAGLVKGWAIFEAANILRRSGFRNFYVEIAGDIQTYGHPNVGKYWKIGIRNPFKREEIIKVVKLSGQGIATSGTYMQGEHIWNPKKEKLANEIIAITVIGPNIYEADRFATAAFAVGKTGINFIQGLPGFEAYSIDKKGVATITLGFEKYIEEKND